jgi:hypothetical protein
MSPEKRAGDHEIVEGPCSSSRLTEAHFHDEISPSVQWLRPRARLCRGPFSQIPRDAAHPMRIEAVWIPSGGVLMNGFICLAAGTQPHPTVLILHGSPATNRTSGAGIAPWWIQRVVLPLSWVVGQSGQVHPSRRRWRRSGGRRRRGADRPVESAEDASAADPSAKYDSADDQPKSLIPALEALRPPIRRRPGWETDDAFSDHRITLESVVPRI